MNNRTVLKLPSWLPGARFKRYAQEWYPAVTRAAKAPYDKVKRELVCVSGSYILLAISKIRSFRQQERQLLVSLQILY